MCGNSVGINNSKLEEFDFKLKEILKIYQKIENKKLRLLFDNYNSNNNLGFNSLFIFS